MVPKSPLERDLVQNLLYTFLISTQEALERPEQWSGLTIVRLDGVWDSGTFHIESRFGFRIRPHDPSIQIDTTHTLISCQGLPGKLYYKGIENWQNVVQEGSQAILGSRWKISRNWERQLAGNPGAHPVGLFPGSKTRKYGPRSQEMSDFPGFRTEIITY